MLAAVTLVVVSAWGCGAARAAPMARRKVVVYFMFAVGGDGRLVGLWSAEEVCQ